MDHEEDEVYGLRGILCSGFLDKWVRERVTIPFTWDDIVYASWVLWPDKQTLIVGLLAEKEWDLELLQMCLLEDLERGEDVLASAGYNPALWIMVLEVRRILERMEADECCSEEL